jgi:hypothetical protein
MRRGSSKSGAARSFSFCRWSTRALSRFKLSRKRHCRRRTRGALPNRDVTTENRGRRAGCRAASESREACPLEYLRVTGNHGRTVHRRIVPDLLAALALSLQNAPEPATLPAELGVGHAGTTSGTRVGVVSGRKPGGSASPVSSITVINSRAMSGASPTTSSGLAPLDDQPGQLGTGSEVWALLQLLDLQRDLVHVYLLGLILAPCPAPASAWSRRERSGDQQRSSRWRARRQPSPPDPPHSRCYVAHRPWRRERAGRPGASHSGRALTAPARIAPYPAAVSVPSRRTSCRGSGMPIPPARRRSASALYSSASARSTSGTRTQGCTPMRTPAISS